MGSQRDYKIVDGGGSVIGGYNDGFVSPFVVVSSSVGTVFACLLKKEKQTIF